MFIPAYECSGCGGGDWDGGTCARSGQCGCEVFNQSSILNTLMRWIISSYKGKEEVWEYSHTSAKGLSFLDRS